MCGSEKKKDVKAGWEEIKRREVNAKRRRDAGGMETCGEGDMGYGRKNDVGSSIRRQKDGKVPEGMMEQ
jgi:hypothetical protein